MAYTNIFVTDCAFAVMEALAKGLKYSMGLLAIAHKEVLEPGEYSRKVPLPGTVTAGTRAINAVLPTGQQPTDTTCTLTPVIEYTSAIAGDRLTTVATKAQVLDIHAPLAAAAMLTNLNTALWALVTTGNFENTPVGTAGSSPDISVLAQARKSIWDAKCNDMGNLYAVIGGEEGQVWRPSLKFNEFGPAGQGALTTGVLPNAYGFKIVEDQQRLTAGTTAYNFCLHPLALMVGFRSSLPSRGYPMGQATDPDTGITIFTEESPTNDSSNGVGTQLTCSLVADIKVGYANWGTILYGAV
jgi:hypothetical protein